MESHRPQRVPVWSGLGTLFIPVDRDTCMARDNVSAPERSQEECAALNAEGRTGQNAGVWLGDLMVARRGPPTKDVVLRADLAPVTQGPLRRARTPARRTDRTERDTASQRWAADGVAGDEMPPTRLPRPPFAFCNISYLVVGSLRY